MRNEIKAENKQNPKKAFIDWQAERLFPLAEKLMRHADQPYSGNMALSIKQAAVRLTSNLEDRSFAEKALSQIIAANWAVQGQNTHR